MSNGVILWQGPSQLDGKPIVAIATGLASKSTNVKTGAMVQTYILRSDMEPIEALKAGEDASICGSCPLRGDGTGKGRACYVNLGHGPLAVYRAFKRGVYPTWAQADYPIAEGRAVRLGTYGDPAAVPIEVWNYALTDASGHTGYTHQWRAHPELKSLCMASVDTVRDMQEARAQGWRTFRVDGTHVIGAQKGEVLCPASKEAGRKLTCEQCLACCGADGRKGSIYIPAHGSGAVHARAA
jgi:hypothetical protein